MNDEKKDPLEPRPRRGRRRAYAVAFGLFVALLALEVGLRIQHGVAGTYELGEEARFARENGVWKASLDPGLIYVHRPDAPYRGRPLTNEHGIIRDGAVSPRKPPGMFRVAVLGDSIGAGLPLRDGDRFPAALERLLARSNPSGAPRAQALNFCVDGYDTVQEARLLETRVRRFEPDALVVQYCMNDPGTSIVPFSWFREPEEPLSHAFAFLRDGVLSVLGAASGDEFVPVEGPDRAARSHWQRMYAPEGAGWRKVLNGFDRIAAWSRQSEVPVFLVVFPLLLPDDPEGASTAGFREQVTSAGEERGFRVVPLQRWFENAGVASVLSASYDIYHPNARGQGMAAEALHLRMLTEMRR